MARVRLPQFNGLEFFHLPDDIPTLMEVLQYFENVSDHIAEDFFLKLYSLMQQRAVKIKTVEPFEPRLGFTQVNYKLYFVCLCYSDLTEEETAEFSHHFDDLSEVMKTDSDLAEGSPYITIGGA